MHVIEFAAKRKKIFKSGYFQISSGFFEEDNNFDDRKPNIVDCGNDLLVECWCEPNGFKIKWNKLV